MKRPLKPEEVKIWGMVSATVHPLPGRGTPIGKSPTISPGRAHLTSTRYETANA